MQRMIQKMMIVGLLIGMLGACAAPAPPAADTPEPHGHAGHGLATSDEPYDALFIDSMIVHHQGALDMAEAALAEAQRPELRELAAAILATQQAEIEQLQAWRAQWYPDLPPTSGMELDMGPMEVATDSPDPFELRFIDAMIPHHEGAVQMAEDALNNAEHAELKAMATEIIAAQQAEIGQMRRWREQWQ